MKIIFHGHACVEIHLNDGTRLLVDPFLTGNPSADISASEIESDYILVTHGHSDHIGDTVAIAKRTHAQVISNVEIVSYAESFGVAGHGMNLGGEYQFPFGSVKFVPALHSSSLEIDGVPRYMGTAAGIILQVEGHTIYHAGDTALFSDLRLIGDQYDLDVVFLPIGDNFTMGPKDAAQAAAWLQAKCVIPIHYNTFPIIEQDPYAFTNQIENGRVLLPGESIELEG